MRPADRPHRRSPVREGVQRPAGRGPLCGRPAEGTPGLRPEERVHRRTRVRGRGRERPYRRPARVPQDDRCGIQAHCSLQRDPGLEVLPVHPQAGARCCLQVHAPAQGSPRRLHHRARRRHPDGQAHGGHHRERGRVLQREPGPGGHQGDAGSCLPRLLGHQQDTLRLQSGHGAGRGQEEAHPGTRPRRLPGRQTHLRHGGGRNGDAAHRQGPQRRGDRQPCRASSGPRTASTSSSETRSTRGR